MNNCDQSESSCGLRIPLLRRMMKMKKLMMFSVLLFFTCLNVSLCVCVSMHHPDTLKCKSQCVVSRFKLLEHIVCLCACACVRPVCVCVCVWGIVKMLLLFFLPFLLLRLSLSPPVSHVVF